MPYAKRELRLGLRSLNLGLVNLHSVGGRTLSLWRVELIRHFGGEEKKLTPVQTILINDAVRMRAYLDDIDTFLLTLPTIMNRKRKRVLTALVQRQELSAHLCDVLRQLGLSTTALDKKPPVSFTVADLMREAEQKKSAGASARLDIPAPRPPAAEVIDATTAVSSDSPPSPEETPCDGAWDEVQAS